MRSFFSVMILISMLTVTSCKHQQKTVSTGMTSAKATEEEAFVQGCVDKSSGNYTKALESFLKCLSLNPKSAAANYEVAGIYSRTYEFDRALTYSKASTELSPENVFYKLRYAELLQGANQLTESIKIYKEITDSHPENTEFLFKYASVLRMAGKNSEALKVYDKIELVEGISDTLANEKIATYKIVGDKVGEENTLVNVLTYFPSEKNFERLVEFDEKNKKDVAPILSNWSKHFPLAVRPYLKTAELQKKSNVPSENQKSFLTAKSAFALPGDLDAKINFLNSNYSISDSSKALTTNEKTDADSLCAILRRTHSDDARVYTLSANYFFKEGKNTEARTFYHTAASLGQSDYGGWKRLMEINYNLKDDVAQEKDCNSVLELFPTQPDAYYYLAIVSYNKKDFKKANDWIQLGLDLSPDDARMNEEMGNIQYRLGKSDIALTYWRKAKEKGGTNPALDRKITTNSMNENE